MPELALDGHTLHWDEAGTGSPVLLVMGASYSSKMWWPTIPGLSAKHRVIWFDNRGTGQSTATKVASISDMAGDARAVLDAAGVDKAAVYGVSLGGVVTIELALQSPERISALVLGCTGILTSEMPRAPRLVVEVLGRMPRSLMRKLATPASYGPACSAERYAADRAVLDVDKAETGALLAQQAAIRAYSVTTQRVATITAPTLVLHGTADKVVKLASGQELAATIPGAQLITYEGAGHNYPVAMEDVATDDVLRFLDGVSSART